MKFCQHCGSETNDNAIVCVKCGCSIQTSTPTVDESISVGLVVLAILFPIFGLIYWPVNAKTRPKCAMACGIAAIISWAICLLFLI